MDAEIRGIRGYQFFFMRIPFSMIQVDISIASSAANEEALNEL